MQPSEAGLEKDLSSRLEGRLEGFRTALEENETRRKKHVLSTEQMCVSRKMRNSSKRFGRPVFF